MANEFLLEVRAEEIPDRMLRPAVRQLAGRLFEDLTTRGIAPRELATGYTPRRLLVTIRGLEAREPDREEQVVGPPLRVAYKDGEPTRALTGFAQKCGVAPEDLETIQTDKGEYLAATQRTVGRSTPEVLAQIVPEILQGLNWAKNMRWGTGVGPWVRPVHGIVALFNREIVPFELFGVASGAETVGHPILSPSSFTVSGIDDYHAQLAERGLEARPDARRETLLERMHALAEEAGGELVHHDALLDSLTGICEIPGVVAGHFDERFLELPREVLITSLRDHQHAFTIEDKQGNLKPVFLTVMDRPDDPAGRVGSGNEWVVAARLEDGRFFYDEDRKLRLADRRRQLERLTFHDKLGSYADKASRLADLAEYLCTELGWDDERAEAVEAARLLKADLPTEMVKEFDSLQGIMGGLYAREEGYEEAVWQALYDQYLPASTDDRIPRGRVGRITALADRLDTLAGMFGLGLIPSGSKDPFGLRRAAQALVRILLEGEIALDPLRAMAKAVDLYGERLTADRSATLEAWQTFLADRVRHLLSLRDYAYDEVEAAVAVGSEAGDSLRNLPDLHARLDAVHRIREDENFLSVALSAKRISNILKDAPAQRLDPARLEEPAEKALHEAYEGLAGDVEAAAADGDYLRCLQHVGDLASVLDRFFEDVMVMAKDEALRNNRIALLQAIDAVISRTAKLTELVVDKAEHRG